MASTNGDCEITSPEVENSQHQEDARSRLIKLKLEIAETNAYLEAAMAAEKFKKSIQLATEKTLLVDNKSRKSRTFQCGCKKAELVLALLKETPLSSVCDDHCKTHKYCVRPSAHREPDSGIKSE